MAQQENETARDGEAVFEGGVMHYFRNAPNKSLQPTFNPSPILHR